jgi:hypothetical protein
LGEARTLTRRRLWTSRSASGETALELAVRYGRDSVLQLLLESGVDVTMPNRAGQSAFHTAAAAGQYKALRTIMPYTTLTATQMKDNQGRTPLHSCAEGDFWQVRRGGVCDVCPVLFTRKRVPQIVTVLSDLRTAESGGGHHMN